VSPETFASFDTTDDVRWRDFFESAIMTDMTTPVRVIVDSAADIPPAHADALDIRTIPLMVRFGDETIPDGPTDDPQAFWRRLHLSSELPETSSPSAFQFETALKDASNDGAPGAVIVTVSSRMSATYAAAVIAAENMAGSIPTKVVDSRTVSMAEGFAAMAAAEAAANGAPLVDVAAEAARVSAHTDVLAALDTLDLLEHGGRIGGASVFVGNLLNVKPLLTIEDGVVAPAGRVRSRRAAIDVIVEHVLGLPMLHDLAVIHGHATDLHYLIGSLAPRIGRDRIIEACLGPVIATHTGPGVLGVAYRTH